MAVGWMYNNQKWYCLDENGDMATVQYQMDIRWNKMVHGSNNTMLC